MAPGVGTVVAEFQPFEDLPVEVDTARDSFLSAVLDDTLGVIVGQGHIVIVLVLGAVQRQRVILSQGGTRDFVNPVGALCDVVRVLVDEARQRGVETGHIGMVGICAERSDFVAVHLEFRSVHNVQFAGQPGEAYVALEGDSGVTLASRALLGRDDDDAVRSAASVDGRGRSVLQHGNAGDIVGVEVVEVVDGVDDSVHDEQRLIGRGDGTGTADSDGSGRTRGAVGGHKVSTCDTALEGVVRGKHWRALDILHLDVGHGAREVLFLHGAVSDHNHLVQHIAVFLESEVVNGPFARDAGGRGLVTHKQHFDDVSLVDLEGVSAVDAGCGALRGVLDSHGSARKGRTVGIDYLARDGQGLVLRIRFIAQASGKQHAEGDQREQYFVE